MISGPQTTSIEALATLSSHSPLRANVMPMPSAKPLAPGATRAQVDTTLGAPTKTVGAVSLYSYVSSSQEHKIMAGYFDGSKHLLRFARYAAKDGKIIDEITQAELSSGAELPFIRGLLAKPGSTSADIGASLPRPNSSQ
jgi:outer membrane protein assembly factor BamE (lipoprotein component of BamABCDE complex)